MPDRLAAAQTVKRVIYVFGVEIDLNTLHAWLRRSAHAVLFFISGVLFFASFSRSLKNLNSISQKLSLFAASRHSEPVCARCITLQSFLLSSALCSACAVIAETVKVWIPGRHLQLSEALLDVAGAVCGAWIAAAAVEAARYMKRRPKRGEAGVFWK